MAGRQLNPLRLPVGDSRGKVGTHVPKAAKDSNAAVGVRDRATRKAPEGMTDRQTNKRTNFLHILLRWNDLLSVQVYMKIRCRGFVRRQLHLANVWTTATSHLGLNTKSPLFLVLPFTTVWKKTILDDVALKRLLSKHTLSSQNRLRS